MKQLETLSLEIFKNLESLSLTSLPEITLTSQELSPLILAGLFHKNPKAIIIVVSSYEKILVWQAKLELCGILKEQIFTLPSGIFAIFEDSIIERNSLSDRIQTWNFLSNPKPGIVITTPQAVLEKGLPSNIFNSLTLHLKTGQLQNFEDLKTHLIHTGYEFTDPVKKPGEFSVRGGVIDIFIMGYTMPTRIEFFGDQIESIREFEPDTQRSLTTLENILILPARETLYPSSDDYLDQIKKTISPEAQDEIISDLQSLQQRIFFDRIDHYRKFLQPDSQSAVEILGKKGLLVLEDTQQIEINFQKMEEELQQTLHARIQRGEIISSFTLEDSIAPFKTLFDYSVFGLNKSIEKSNLDVITLQAYEGRPQELSQAMKSWMKQNIKVILCTDQPVRAKKILADQDLHPQEFKDTLQSGTFYIAQGNLGGGFFCPELQLAILTDKELFGVSRLKLPQKRFKEAAVIDTLLDLKEGDLVVHIQFGIGTFKGLTKRIVQGIEKEYLSIDYAEPDKLFVPVDQLDRVQKYLNPAESNPKINRLGGGDWQKAVTKARQEAKEFAQDLISLYAVRKQAERQPYTINSPWLYELETTFPWVETPAQLAAIQEIKRDLSGPNPMDRLICGDVGFGKTEIAIRAAFIVGEAQKQVVVLCPTTILSEQHYRSFKERFAGFGINIELLNRFKTTAEKKKIIADLEKGGIDVLIGTHSLISKKLKFHDLGLVIIDEEQKFGVKQKETLKSYRANIDVLSMSATPIPRTMNMALMDIRQMSLINTPLPGRLPIRTIVKPYSKQTVTEAIYRELSRGGQVFYVYNRVQGIYHVAEILRKMIPDANIGVAHGQMNEEDLEPIMLDFIEGKIDILLSTSIVESGLDISNSNTLIVEDADRFGLAQLYQLRGRVGRSDRQAYAYLLYSSDRELTENGNIRLKSLQEFSQLGSGYSLAFRDLQIRGAGDLIGAKQHGTMASVGYELFMQLIHQEVKCLKESTEKGISYEQSTKMLEKRREPLPPVELPISAFIPPPYVKDDAQRLYLYKCMMGCRELHELQAVQEEIKDRYGPLPEEVHNAFAVVRLRIKALQYEIRKITVTDEYLVINFVKDYHLTPRHVSILTHSQPRMKFSANTGQLYWEHKRDPLKYLEKFFDIYESIL